MPLTPSQMLALGTVAPEFDLPDPSGRNHALRDARDATAVLVMFLCNHCPFVRHVRHELAALGRDYQRRGVAIYGISANDVVTHPEDAPAKMADEARANGWTFPYLFDETQEVAKAYHAACTPDFFLFDAARKLVYRGQLDDSRPDNGRPVTGKDLRAALDAVLQGKPVAQQQQPSIGCNIKWQAGNAPAWFG